MKTFRFAAVLLWLLAAASLGMAEEDETEVSQLLSNLNIQTTLIEADDYKIVHITVDRLEEGKEFITRRYLYESNQYKIIGLGGPNVKDFDLYVYDDDDDVVDKDADTTNVPILTFSPPSDGNYKFKAKIYKAEEGHDDEELFFSYVIGWKRED